MATLKKNKKMRYRATKSALIKPIDKKTKTKITYKKTPKLIKPKQINDYNKEKIPVSVKQRTPPVVKHKTIKKKPNKLIQKYASQKIDKPIRILDGSNVPYSKYKNKLLKLKNIGEGRILIMIACGPSVLEAPLELLKDKDKIDFMVLNKPYGFDNIGKEEHSFIWPSKYWSFCDQSQYNRNQKAWDTYQGIIINSPGVRQRKNNQIMIKNLPGNGFSKNIIKGYHIGRSTTYANMQVAYWMNYDRIYIFGLDMTDVNGKLHSYGVNPDVSPKNRKARFKNEAEFYGQATNILNKQELSKFIICSSYNPWDFMKKFRRLDQKKAPQIILKECFNE